MKGSLLSDMLSGNYKMLRICKFSTYRGCSKSLRDHCDPLWATILDFSPNTASWTSFFFSVYHILWATFHTNGQKKITVDKRFNRATEIIEQIQISIVLKNLLIHWTLKVYWIIINELLYVCDPAAAFHILNISQNNSLSPSVISVFTSVSLLVQHRESFDDFLVS